MVALASLGYCGICCWIKQGQLLKLRSDSGGSALGEEIAWPLIFVVSGFHIYIWGKVRRGTSLTFGAFSLRQCNKN